MPNNLRVSTEDVPHVQFPGPAESDRLGRFIPPTMLREGDYWTILYRGRLLRVRHNKGLSYLAHLVARPWESLHVSELYGRERGAAGSTGSTGSNGSNGSEAQSARPVESDRKAVTSRIRAALTSIQACDLTLGEHFLSTITTGTYCGYSPRPETSVR